MKTSGNERSPQDLGKEVYELLCAKIRNGVLRPGQRITEMELAERLGTSRTPIRQALAKLEAEGLLSHEPRRGLIISRPDHQQVIELYQMREVLEGAAARFAALHASESELTCLRRLVEEEASIGDGGAALSAINLKIHTLLHRAACNRYLLRSLTLLTNSMTVLPTRLGDRGRASQSHAEHVAILDAVERRDGDAAEAAMRIHMRSAQDQRISWLLEDIDGIEVPPGSGPE
jgi:DNA-binding GntR family transcriptional regulator